MPCLLGLSATERSSLRSHYGLLADRLNLGLGQLAQKQPKIVGSAQEHELYFKDQQTLLHNFLRQEAVLTQRSMHEALPVETPLSLMMDSPSQASSSTSSVASSSISTSTTSVSSTERSLCGPKEDKYSAPVSSAPLPLTSSPTTQPSNQLPNTPHSNLKFFQTHKPAVIKNETPSELNHCISKFQELFDDHSYTL